jgi:cholesterol transport system auxiliary component
MRVPARLSRRWAPTIIALALAGCGGLFGGSSPAQLYRVTPVHTFPPGLPHLPVQVLIDEPLAPAGLDTTRIALSRSAVSIEYFADSEWTDRVPLMVQTALLESFEDSKALSAINRESLGLHADFILKTEIRHFEALYDSPNQAPEAWVAIITRLVNPSGRDIVSQASFERRVRAETNDVPQIVLAFQEALEGVMEDIVVWTAGNPALSPKRR